MRVYRTGRGAVVEHDDRWYELTHFAWDTLFSQPDPVAWLAGYLAGPAATEVEPASIEVLTPIGSQEVWAAGVTYYRSRTARMEEAETSGGGSFYDRVYAAERPELFFKAAPHRVVGPGEEVRIRDDATWSVPEPELTLCVAADGSIFGYTIGNDMSSRDIEGQNPLYLPQAKVYDGCCALGPCLLVAEDPLPSATEISMVVERGGKEVFAGATQLEQMKRSPDELVEYLFRCNSFPQGCLLLTGTGVVPPNDFTLAHGDTIRITIEPIGTLENTVA